MIVSDRVVLLAGDAGGDADRLWERFGFGAPEDRN